MKIFDEYLNAISNPNHQDIMRKVLMWVLDTFPNLEPKIAWNQPMFTDHGTYIIGFSVSKNHFSFAPEEVVVKRFSEEIVNLGYDHTKQLVRIKWNQEINVNLIKKIIAFNIQDKSECNTFWRKP